MSKFRSAAVFGAVLFVGLAVSAGAQAPAKTDSARGMRDGGPRPERVEGMRRMRMERGMRQGKMQRGRHGDMHRGMRQGMRGGMRGGEFGRGMRGGDFGRGMGQGFGARIELTDAQKTRVKSIHEKYQPQFKTLREQSATRMKAMRDARQKGDTSAAARQRFMQEREQFRTRATAIRQQQQNEIRGILTPEQRTRIDAAREAQAKQLDERAKQIQEQARQLRSR